MCNKKTDPWITVIRGIATSASVIVIMATLMTISVHTASIGWKLKPLMKLKDDTDREFQDYGITSYTNIQDSRFVTIRYTDNEGNLCLFGITIGGPDDLIIITLTKGRLLSERTLEHDLYTTSTVNSLIGYQSIKEAYPEFRPGFRYLDDFLLKMRYDISLT